MASPERKSLSSEAKVGLLFFAGIGLALWFTFSATEFGRPDGEFSVRFRTVSQLKEGDIVTFNGVRVGVVTMVVPERDGERVLIRVYFAIDKPLHDVVLVDGTTQFRIVLGTLGGAALDVRSTGGAPITQPAIAEHFGKEGASLGDAVSNVSDLVEENRAGIRAAIKSFEDAMVQIRDLVAENRTVINAAITNFDRMGKQIADLVADNRTTIDAALVNIRDMTGQIENLVRENRADLKTAMAALPKAVENFRDAAGRVEALLAENQEDVRVLMRNLAEVAPKVDRIGNNLELITAQIAEGKGTVGKLVMDDTLHDNAVATVDALGDRLDEVKPFTQGLTQLRLSGIVWGAANTDSGSATGYAGLRLEPRPWKFFDAGVSYRTAPSERDTEDDDKPLPVDLNLTIGWRYFPDDRNQVYRLHVAAGVLEGKLGGYVLAPVWKDQLTLTVLARGKANNLGPLERTYEDGEVMLRSWFEYRPFRRWGIFLVAGVDDIVDDPAPWIGLKAQLYDDDFRNLLGLASFGG